MRLKVLIVPFFIVMILVLGIGYIKPDIDASVMKRDQIKATEDQVAKIETVLANISALNASLDTQPEAEKFMYRYLPSTLSQEQAIDSFNFLATQSGVSIVNIGLKQEPEAVVIEELIIDPATNIFVAGGTGIGSAGVPVVAPSVVVKKFTLSGSVVGSYENIKLFFDHLAHTERFHTVRLFSLATTPNQATSAGAEAESSGNLTGVFEAEYGYLPSKPVASAWTLPVFWQSKLDLTKVGNLVSATTSAVPSLEKGESGKPNPFQ